MARLQLTLLGGFEARIIPGEPLDIATRKTRALLAYLALPTGRAHSRDKLTAVLWSDRGDEQARNSLRQTLAELVRVLARVEPSPLVKDTLALDPRAVEVDAIAFERLSGSEAADDLRRSVSLYAGELLEGFAVRDPAFEEWLRHERQRYEELAITTLKKLLSLDSPDNAMALAQRLVALAPLQEDGYRTLMRVHAEAGDMAAALHQYEVCREVLKRELDTAPSPQTEALHRQIRGLPDTLILSAQIQPAAQARDSPSGGQTTKPSIAVLPFRNLNADPDQQYLSDGITEDIITELSRYRELMVIARNSSFRFREQSADTAQIGRELGADYLLEGSLRKAGNRLRITAQLIEAASGGHLWAERYDRNLEDVFEIQDDVTQTITATFFGQLARTHTDRARRRPKANWQAYDYVLQGLQCIARYDTKQAEIFFQEAIKLDPEYAQAHAMLAVAYLQQYFDDLRDEALAAGRASAEKAVLLDGSNPYGHCHTGIALMFQGDLEAPEAHLDRAVSLNPNSVWCLHCRAAWLCRVRRTQEALAALDVMARHDPLLHPSYWEVRSVALFAEHRYEEVVASTRQKNRMKYWDHAYLAAAYAYLGRRGEAQAEAAEVLRKRPDFSIRAYAKQEPYKNPADRDHLLEGMRIAGLPE
jgi:TolB-like protein/Tfp pilus assembly protein PilF